MESKTNFIMMMGLAGSGKSTVAKEMIESELKDSKRDIVYLSSDDIREEILGDVNEQSRNSEVFETMFKRTKENLKNGVDVVYDATNLSTKRRKHLLSVIGKDVKKTILYMPTPYEICVKQDSERNRSVGEEVISKMYKNAQTPIYSEGWDSIVYLYHDSVETYELPIQYTDGIRLSALTGNDKYYLIEFLCQHFSEFQDILELPQDSTYHSFSVSRHTYEVYKYILNTEFDTQRDKEIMIWSALLHDTGKAFCKSFVNFKGEETRYANFIGHENVSAQLSINFLKKMNFSDSYIYEISTIVRHHMYLLDRNASEKKLVDRVGSRTFELLKTLRHADENAH